jgi:hypothetical protein
MKEIIMCFIQGIDSHSFFGSLFLFVLFIPSETFPANVDFGFWPYRVRLTLLLHEKIRLDMFCQFIVKVTNNKENKMDAIDFKNHLIFFNMIHGLNDKPICDVKTIGKQ